MSKKEDLGPLPTAHPRHVPFQRAKVELADAVLALWKKHDLTSAELFLLLSEQMASLASTVLRHERHPKEATE